MRYLEMFRVSLFVFIATLTLTPAAFAEPKPDNSKRNADIQKMSAKTAENQEGNKDSIETTRNIRKALVGDSSLSTYAHNVKIITSDGKVTLKGPVRSADEKAKVESIAIKAAGSTTVSSELEVAPK